MPELTATHIVLLVVLAIAGAVAGWYVRDRRAAQEKETVKAMWQDEIVRQRRKQKRLADQNKGLMELIRQQQAHQSRLKKQVADLSATLRDTDTRHDGLQREIESRDARNDKLSREIKNWRARLPPLIERYRVRNEEAEQLEAELEEALSTIHKLEVQRDEAAPRSMPIEPLRSAGPLTDGLEASNDDDDEFVDEIDEESTPVFLDEETMIECEALPDDDEAVAGDISAAGDAEPDDSPQERDNLKKIKGVGPAIEKTLNEMGIFSFRHVAEMSDYDVDRVARRLKGFHGRIHREDWIGQARTLLDRAASA